jgi:hypothetical protein
METANAGHGKTDGQDGEGENYPALVIQGRCIEVKSLVVRYYCRWKEKK